jgi:hypothetical protein
VNYRDSSAAAAAALCRPDVTGTRRPSRTRMPRRSQRPRSTAAAISDATAGVTDSIWELGPCGYVWICWISMDMYVYLRASSGTYPTCCTGLDIHPGYPCISMHIHAYPSMILEISTFYIQKSCLCIIHAVIHQGIHSYPYSTLHIHVYSSEISILDIHSYPYSISMY